MPCLSPGLLVYQPPLSPSPQALSAGQAEPPSAGTGSSEATCGEDMGSSRSFLHRFISLFTALSVHVLFAPYRAIKPAQCGLMNPASSGLSWSCSRGVKLLVKSTWVGFLPLLGMMLGEGCHLLLSSTCETFPNKAPPQPLPTPRGEEAGDEVAGNAKAISGKSLEQRVGAAPPEGPSAKLC